MRTKSLGSVRRLRPELSGASQTFPITTSMTSQPEIAVLIVSVKSAPRWNGIDVDKHFVRSKFSDEAIRDPADDCGGIGSSLRNEHFGHTIRIRFACLTKKNAGCQQSRVPVPQIEALSAALSRANSGTQAVGAVACQTRSAYPLWISWSNSTLQQSSRPSY